MDDLKFITCGSVDDGKSTLMGRLLHDTGVLYEDQKKQLQKINCTQAGVSGNGNSNPESIYDFAYLLDGLESEREQGITIDVAYRYFSTERRNFRICDSPGHEQYTRNMATAASQADLAVILVDAKSGVQLQTRRHSYIAYLLGIRYFVVAVNKMDLVEFNQTVFQSVCEKYKEFVHKLQGAVFQFIPVSALIGENVTQPSRQMPWYHSSYLLEYLENITIGNHQAHDELRFYVQYVNRLSQEFRGYCGTVNNGELHSGQTIQVLPSKKQSRIKSIYHSGKRKRSAYRGQSITVQLYDELDIDRGSILIAPKQQIDKSQKVVVDVVWFSDQTLELGNRYWVKHLGKMRQTRITNIRYKIDLENLSQLQADQVRGNDIARCIIEFSESIYLEPYAQNREFGSMILIDPVSHETVGAAMVESIHAVALPIAEAELSHSDFERDFYQLVQKYFSHWLK